MPRQRPPTSKDRGPAENEKGRQPAGTDVATGARARARARGSSRKDTAPRSSAKEVEARIERILKICKTTGWTRAAEVALAAEWGVSDRTVSGYAAEAWRRIRGAASSVSITDWIENNRVRADAIYTRAMAKGDFHGAAAGLRESARNLEMLQRGSQGAPVERPFIKIEYATPAPAPATKTDGSDPVQPAADPGPPGAANTR